MLICYNKIGDTMFCKVQKYIKENDLLRENEKVVLALSGGIDSMVLLDILLKLKYQVIIAHVNHNRRIESIHEYYEIQELAKSLNLNFEYLDLHIDSNNFQHEARIKRYDFFLDVAKKYQTDKIITAHHLDDLAETILINLIRGSNLSGYAGIKNRVSYKHSLLIRPLLCLSKEEIIDYQKKHNLKYFEDLSNQSNEYLRNRIRNMIMPLLKQENGQLLDKMEQFSLQLNQNFLFVRNLSLQYLKNYQGLIHLPTYKEENEVIQNDIINYLLESKQIKCSLPKLIELKKLILNSKANLIHSLNQNYELVKAYDYVKIALKKKEEFYYKLLNLDEILVLPNKDKIYFTKKLSNINLQHLKLCYNKMAFPFIIRSKRNGDQMKFRFGHKRVSRIFIDKKIPIDKRAQYYIVTDYFDNIVWIPNLIQTNLLEEDIDLFLVYEKEV